MKNDYKNIINEYIYSIKEKLDDNLEMIYIIGSSASESVILNWSDIDVIIVLKEYNIRSIETIKKESNAFNIKIGNTIYIKEELENCNIDAKTYYYLYLFHEKKLNINYYKSTLIIPEITYEQCANATRIVLFNDVHNLKRFLTYQVLTKNDAKVIFKKIYVIMKSILILYKQYPKNYKETFESFSKTFNFEYFDYLHYINNFRSDNIDFNQLKKYALNLIIYVSKINLLKITEEINETI